MIPYFKACSWVAAFLGINGTISGTPFKSCYAERATDPENLFPQKSYVFSVGGHKRLTSLAAPKIIGRV